MMNGMLHKGRGPSAAYASESSVAPPPKKRRLICSGVFVEKEKTPKIVYVKHVKVAPILHPQTDVEVREVGGVEDMVSSSIQPELANMKENSLSEDIPTDIFVPRPYLSHEKRPVNVKDSDMMSCRVGHTLARSMILLEDGRRLKTIRTFELEHKGFQRVAEVSHSGLFPVIFYF